MMKKYLRLLRVQEILVEDEDMFDIVKGSRDVVEAVQMLIEKANSNGGRDNIGVVIAEPLADEVSIW